ncbi:BMC domain-containing protein [Bacillus sp. P14.5]|uniref:BMC domain-containing protein n=1 Tax=Bacillus sp. P14.5 TaxID=1983400 RepID=UPI000DE925DA|nr:BMC domain-containing protein [Bacillus sp. P14.5]
MGTAIGLLEVQGFSTALAAMDKACKAAHVKIEGIDCNNPAAGENARIPVVIQVKITGNMSEVQVALDAAKDEAARYIDHSDISVHLITSSMKGIEKLLPLGKVKVKT